MDAIYLRRFIKMLWIFSVILFLSILLYVYAGLPEIVSITTSVGLFKSFLVGKADIFYGGLAIFIISNLCWYLLAKVISKIKTAKASQSIPYLSSNRILAFVNWITSFSLLINILLIVSLIMLGVTFGEQLHDLASMRYIIYGIISIMAVWFLILIFVAIRKERYQEIA